MLVKASSFFFYHRGGNVESNRGDNFGRMVILLVYNSWRDCKIFPQVYERNDLLSFSKLCIFSFSQKKFWLPAAEFVVCSSITGSPN